ncbi:hypothetical protein [sulfur-oxidizing endosymbiont of Gigantopelta aegis]|uniref:ATPase, T2SS/T4P/T4SS family n=1 Tax=sulfur-oxidizing endosymbiont of Gigantopelta aegis TaxID=2794934 RepID=UPI001BE4A12A|nr:hypothetical protein [sulfur-oxidizing endosymbiont of Gigantopelta aegis]
MNEPLKNNQFSQGNGCHLCNNTGYKGRQGVHEILEINDALAEALRSSDARAFVKKARSAPGYIPLVNSAFELAKQGITSIDEVLRLAGSIEEHAVLEEQ